MAESEATKLNSTKTLPPKALPVFGLATDEAAADSLLAETVGEEVAPVSQSVARAEIEEDERLYRQECSSLKSKCRPPLPTRCKFRRATIGTFTWQTENKWDQWGAIRSASGSTRPWWALMPWCGGAAGTSGR